MNGFITSNGLYSVQPVMQHDGTVHVGSDSGDSGAVSDYMSFDLPILEIRNAITGDMIGTVEPNGAVENGDIADYSLNVITDEGLFTLDHTSSVEIQLFYSKLALAISEKALNAMAHSMKEILKRLR